MQHGGRQAGRFVEAAAAPECRNDVAECGAPLRVARPGAPHHSYVLVQPAKLSASARGMEAGR